MNTYYPGRGSDRGMLDEQDRKWMEDAIGLARSKGTCPEDTPIAAVIVMNGRVLARGSI